MDDPQENEIRLKEEIYKKVAEVIHFVCNNPLVFFSETDIHTLTMRKLMKINEFNPFNDNKPGLIPTGCTIGLNRNKKQSPKKYVTMLPHTEYGNNAKKAERSDIVIFDKEDVSNIIDTTKLGRKGTKKNDTVYLKPAYIFEFGTEKSAGTKEKYKAHLKRDIRKIRRSKINGFLIHIHRNHSKQKDTKNKIKLTDYKEITKRIWETHKNENIKFLVFFIEIGTSKKRLWGKVQMFDPYDRKKPWKQIPLPEIRQKCMGLLSSVSV